MFKRIIIGLNTEHSEKKQPTTNVVRNEAARGFIYQGIYIYICSYPHCTTTGKILKQNIHC